MMIAQSLNVSPAIFSISHALSAVVAAYAFAETPPPANVVPVPYDNLL
ncbi:hypothetical protein MBA20_17780 [Pectobacterium brasiliense]|nr:hypothetical protein [Pectobacterium brasiliense]UKY56857.1 hypothetical protein MBA20_17780 [Pectobacterium brasiliense]